MKEFITANDFINEVVNECITGEEDPNSIWYKFIIIFPNTMNLKFTPEAKKTYEEWTELFKSSYKEYKSMLRTKIIG